MNGTVKWFNAEKGYGWMASRPTDLLLSGRSKMV